jgi:hypothetical protein
MINMVTLEMLRTEKKSSILQLGETYGARMQSRDPDVYLRHIRDCCLEIAACADLRLSGGVKTDADFRIAHPEIPWRKMIAVRNILIHNYDGIEPEIVFGIVERDSRVADCGARTTGQDHRLNSRWSSRRISVGIPAQIIAAGGAGSSGLPAFARGT